MNPWLIFLIFIFLTMGACSDPAQDQQHLIDAAMSGDNQKVNTLLKNQVDPNCRDKCEWTPLMQAVLYNHPMTVKSLLEKGAVTEPADQAGYNALLIAATHNRFEIIPLLLKYKADINYQEQQEKMSALMIAARAGHQESTSVLLQNGANRLLLDKQGRTALEWAHLKQHADVIQLLQ